MRTVTYEVMYKDAQWEETWAKWLRMSNDPKFDWSCKDCGRWKCTRSQRDHRDHREITTWIIVKSKIIVIRNHKVIGIWVHEWSLILCLLGSRLRLFSVKIWWSVTSFKNADILLGIVSYVLSAFWPSKTNRGKQHFNNNETILCLMCQHSNIALFLQCTE